MPRRLPGRVETVAVGCKVNQYELQLIKESLERSGGPFRGAAAAAERLVLLNTCCVTRRAEKTSMKTLRRLLRENPDALVVATGCLVSARPGLFESLPVLAVPNERKDAIPTLFGAEAVCRVSRFDGHTRAFVKVSDGCPHACTFCIVRRVRGRLRSRAPESIVEEAEALAASGFREIVLVAVNLAAYGTDIGASLAELVVRLAAAGRFPRIRLSSLEPHAVTDELLDVVAATPQVCAHFHLSLQSGSDRVLAAMNRPYTSRDFLSVVERLRRAKERAAVTGDVIVGFPGETEKDFDETAEVVRVADFCRVHVFPFSPRPGTPAERLPGAVDAAEKRERLARLKEQVAAQAVAYRDSLVGSGDSVVVERVEGDFSFGLSERYQTVRIPGRIRPGTLVPVRMEGVDGETLLARVPGGPARKGGAADAVADSAADAERL